MSSRRAVYPAVLAVLAACFAGAAPAAEAPPERSTRAGITRRIRSRTFPSVFQAWSRAEGPEGESRLETMARHDLVFHGVGAFALRWDGRPQGLATRIKPESLPHGREMRKRLLALTHSDGYCLFSDPNPLPTPDHRHNWYPFWEKGLGRPAGPAETRPDGAIVRPFTGGWAVYNPMGNGQVTVEFPRPVTSRATGRRGRVHRVASPDGDILLADRPDRVGNSRKP